MSAPEALVSPLLLGCDFSSRPTRRKPIVLALGRLQRQQVQVLRFEYLNTLEEFADWLALPGHWLGAFDFPFGLPRELVETLDWPTSWAACMAHYAGLSRASIREHFAAFCNARPKGAKFAHRATDLPARSSPSMKWVNPPVAYMLHAGVPLLIQAGVHLPGLHPGDPARVALEGYPGLLAREVLGARSYKSDQRDQQTPQRLIARKDLVTALEQGRHRLGLRLRLSPAMHDGLVDDAKGDSLDAVLCLVQAAWASLQGEPRYGLPDQFDPLEGWILTA